MKQRARAGHQRVYQAVPVDESCPPQLVVTRSTVLEDARRHRTSTQCTSEASTKCLPSSCDRHCQPKLLDFEICFRFLKVPSLSTRAVPNSSSSHVLSSINQGHQQLHLRVCRAIPVDESCPQQLVVAPSTVLKEALRHCFKPRSTECLLNSCD